MPTKGALKMKIEKIKTTLWAANVARAVQFYESCFSGKVIRTNPHITELEIKGAHVAIHGGGEGKRTWTGLTFQVDDVISGYQAVMTAGGTCEKEPTPENGEPPHLAICEDTEGNQFMLSRARS